jgi:hypothetical protein
VFAPPRATALGSLCSHLSREQDDFQPSNIVWSMFPPYEGGRLGKRDRHLALAQRALEDLNPWLQAIGRTPMAAAVDVPDSGTAPAPASDPGALQSSVRESEESDVMRPFVKVENAKIEGAK